MFPLILVQNQLSNKGYSTYKLLKEIHTHAYQFAKGMYRQIWIKRGYMPKYLGEASLQLRVMLSGEKDKAVSLYKQLAGQITIS